jgi:hypothetical protein
MIQLGRRTPEEMLQHDPIKIVDLALGSLDMVAT